MVRYQINLITSKRGEQPTDRLVYFALHYLRYILVLTQIVVISVFLYKFRVDQKIVDLQEEASQKQEIINVSRPLIKEAKAADFAINQTKILIAEQTDFSSMLKYLFDNFPKDLTISKLDYVSGGVNFTGTTQNVTVLKSYYFQLKKDGRFSNVTLRNITKTPTGVGFTFDLANYSQK